MLPERNFSRPRWSAAQFCGKGRASYNPAARIRCLWRDPPPLHAAAARLQYRKARHSKGDAMRTILRLTPAGLALLWGCSPPPPPPPAPPPFATTLNLKQVMEWVIDPA